MTGTAPCAGVTIVAPRPVSLSLSFAGGLRGGLSGLLFRDLGLPVGLLGLVLLGEGAHVVRCPPVEKRLTGSLLAQRPALHAQLEQEELDAIRPDLDGDQIMEILGLRPSRAVKIALD